MNKTASNIIRYFALLLLVAMTLSTVSCDMIDSLFGNDDGGDDNLPCQHENIVDSKCEGCGKIYVTSIEDILADGFIADNTVAEEMYYIKAYVDEIQDFKTGAMTLVDSDDNTIEVGDVFSEDGTPYIKMEARPDEFDSVLLLCVIENKDGNTFVQTAFVVEHTAIGAATKILTVAEALELCGEPGNVTEDRYLVAGTIKSITNPAYGAMIIEDETGEIEVYGTYSSDGEIGYAAFEDKPVKGDDVLLYCILQNYNGNKEIKNARLIDFTHNEVEFDESKYTQMTIAEARDAETDTLVKVSGVVARITYASGYIPNGVILVDGTSSIYVYDGDIAGQSEIGNTITIAARKTYWILGTETNNAEKFGYEGANQLDEAILLANDKGNTAFDKSWITETTVKAIMDTPVSEDITNQIFKVNALVKKAPGSGFTNYYLDDIDGITGSYVYTQCNGGDFDWLDQFDGKICTVYFVAINAKSTSSGCLWRFLPVEVIDEGYTFNQADAAKYAVNYVGLPQFLSTYTGDPAKELSAQVSSELLGFEGATLSYSSSNESVVYFTTDTPGVVTFHCGEEGTATVTVIGSYNGTTYSDEIEITVEANADYDSISIADAIANEVNDEVVVRGIVGPSLVNQAGFYLFDESGMVAIRVADAAVFETIAIGNEVVIKGKRDVWHKEGYEHGQIVISNATVEANYYGDNDYLTVDPILGKDIVYLRNLDKLDMIETTRLYQMEVTIKVVDAQYYSNIYVTDGTNDLILYCSSSSQYSWLKAYDGQTVTVEIAPCNWNSKANFAACVLAVVNEDGTKVLNTLNFK